MYNLSLSLFLFLSKLVKMNTIKHFSNNGDETEIKSGLALQQERRIAGKSQGDWSNGIAIVKSNNGQSQLANRVCIMLHVHEF